MISLTRAEAGRFLLAYQNLDRPGSMQGKAGALQYARKVRCIQFDPIDLVGRNPDLVLQARVDGYRPEILEALLYEDRVLVDGWDKMMSIYPVEDWPFFAPRRTNLRRNGSKRFRAVEHLIPQVRKIIEERGPISSLDLDFDTVIDWSWSPTRQGRAALEVMYHLGEVVVHHKMRSRKVYDLAERVLPPHLLGAPDPHGSREEYHRRHVARRIGSVGMLPGRLAGAFLGIPDLHTKELYASLDALLDAGEVLRVDVEEASRPHYVLSASRELIERTRRGGDEAGGRAAIVAALDNLLWDRAMIREIFGFDYVWEVYKPEAARRFGYYVLPVLWAGRFVARFEPGVDRSRDALLVRKWWWEEGSRPPEQELAACFGRFLSYLGLERVIVEPPAHAEGAGCLHDVARLDEEAV
jgi:uncharacterized protein YcaQ